MSKAEDFKMLSPKEGVRRNPAQFLGDELEFTNQDVYIANVEKINGETTIHIAQKNIIYSRAFEHLLMELLTNAMDNVMRSARKRVNKCDLIEIEISRTKISVRNNGESIPFDKFLYDGTDAKIAELVKDRYIIDVIFSELLSSSNYNDDKERITAGKFGYGAKVVNIFSKYFKVSASNGKKLYEQEWRDGSERKTTPSITKLPEKYNGKFFTEVSYIPLFESFGIEEISDDMMAAFEKLAIDTAMYTNINVRFNNRKYLINNLEEYVNYYYPNVDENNSLIFSKKYRTENKSIDFIVIPNDITEENEFNHISFVNGFFTSSGGKHVDKIYKYVADYLCQYVNTNIQKITGTSDKYKIADIKKNLTIFVSMTMANPSCDTAKTKLIGDKCMDFLELTARFLSQANSWGFIQEFINSSVEKGKEIKVKIDKTMKRDTKIKKLKDANKKGDPRCTLIICEGDSARGFADQGCHMGIEGTPAGWDFFGTYPLRGKVLNPQKTTTEKTEQNAVVKDLMQALGIEGTNIDFRDEKNLKKLKYRRLLILSDADDDGIHIRGLVLNLINIIAPSLVERHDFLFYMRTPIISAEKNGVKTWFYSQKTFEDNKHLYASYVINYYKGLGTYTKQDTVKFFGKKLGQFINDPHYQDALSMAFGKDSNKRKDWMEAFVPSDTFEPSEKDGTEKMDITKFIDGELRVFSLASCARTIPILIDGLKEVQRKILYVCFKNNYVRGKKKLLKVIQLAGAVMNETVYKHGDQSLTESITSMASAFVGSNNLPFLYGEGMFGTRNGGMDDAAKPRYILAAVDTISFFIFRKEDEIILKNKEEENYSIEYEYFLPIIPTILINGCVGIGTGWSTDVPKYNPVDIINYIKTWINLNRNKKIYFKDGEIHIGRLNEEESVSFYGDAMTTFIRTNSLKPWFRGYKGTVDVSTNNDGIQVYTTGGKVIKDNVNSTDSVSIYYTRELPITKCKIDYETTLKTLIDSGKIIEYHDKSNDLMEEVFYEIHMNTQAIKDTTIDEKFFGIISSNLIKNMVMYKPIYSDEGEIASYKIYEFMCIDEIIHEFCKTRFYYYGKRKAAMLNQLLKEVKIATNRVRFIKEAYFSEDFNLEKFITQELTDEDYKNELTRRNYYDNEDNYDYIMMLNFRHMTRESLNKLIREAERKQKIYEDLKKSPIEDIWIKELEELKEKWFEKLAEIEKLENEIASTATARHK